MAGKKENQYIEKFRGDFKTVDGGCTVNHTKTIQNIRNPINLAVYVYLSSKPEEWQANVKDIMAHFAIGRDRVYKALNDLCMMKLLSRVETRSKGQFLEYQYYLHLSPLPENQEMVQPLPEKPLPEKPLPGLPLPENQEAYKEEKFCIKRIESKKRDFIFLSKEKEQKYREYANRIKADINLKMISPDTYIQTYLEWEEDYEASVSLA